MHAVTEAPVEEHLGDAVVRGPVVEAAPGAVLLRLPRVGRFLVRADGGVEVEREVGATDADLRCFLDAPVAAASALLAGLLPLRAAAVAIDGGAVAIAGPSGTGKSALVAALALRGHPVLADAVTVVDGATVRPHAAAPVLWPDAVAQLDLDQDAGRVVRPALPKRAFDLGAAAEPVPLRAVLFLGRSALIDEPDTWRLAGSDTTNALLGAAWYGDLVEPLGLEAARFAQLAQVSDAAACSALVRPRDDCSPVELTARVEELVA
jgi:hypothetical protein